MEMYYYVEHNEDTLSMQSIIHFFKNGIKPIMWAQSGRYGWLPKKRIMNMVRRQRDLDKQQSGYTKDRPINLVFFWGEVQILDPITVKLMRETSQ